MTVSFLVTGGQWSQTAPCALVICCLMCVCVCVVVTAGYREANRSQGHVVVFSVIVVADLSLFRACGCLQFNFGHGVQWQTCLGGCALTVHACRGGRALAGVPRDVPWGACLADHVLGGVSGR